MIFIEKRNKMIAFSRLMKVK